MGYICCELSAQLFHKLKLFNRFHYILNFSGMTRKVASPLGCLLSKVAPHVPKPPNPSSNPKLRVPGKSRKFNFSCWKPEFRSEFSFCKFLNTPIIVSWWDLQLCNKSQILKTLLLWDMMRYELVLICHLSLVFSFVPIFSVTLLGWYKSFCLRKTRNYIFVMYSPPDFLTIFQRVIRLSIPLMKNSGGFDAKNSVKWVTRLSWSAWRVPEKWDLRDLNKW